MSTLTKRQVKTIEKRIDYNGIKCDLVIEARHDDGCGNGHNSFAVTGDIYKAGRRDDNAFLAGGCIHDEIEKHAAELKHLIKWHLCDTDGPIHYIANTLYHARDCDTSGALPGDAIGWDKTVQFADFPKLFNYEARLISYLQEVDPTVILDSEIIEIPHEDTDGYQFSPKYTLGSYGDVAWHQCPFDTMREAEEFLQMVALGYKIVTTPCKWAEAVEPNLQAARNSAIWPNATLEQLQDEDALKARLPALMAEFKSDVEAFGFTF